MQFLCVIIIIALCLPAVLESAIHVYTVHADEIVGTLSLVLQVKVFIATA